MRLSLALALAATTGWATGCASHREARTPAVREAPASPPTPAPTPLAPAVASAATPAPAPSAATPPDLFAQTVRPVLQRSCSPCHEPGGRMYGRLPFDDPGVVRSRAPSVLRRLKTQDDREALERWLASGS